MNYIIIIIISKNLKHIDNIFNFGKKNNIDINNFKFILCSEDVNNMRDYLLTKFNINTLITCLNLNKVIITENVDRYKMTQSILFSKKILEKLYPKNYDLNIFISVSDKETGTFSINDISKKYPLTRILCNIEN